MKFGGLLDIRRTSFDLMSSRIKRFPIAPHAFRDAALLSQHDIGQSGKTMVSILLELCVCEYNLR
jgi:hypothetical protein